MFLPENPEIETARLKIRLAQMADLPALLEMNSNDEVTRYLPYESWKGAADGESWFRRASERMVAGQAGQFVIQQRESSRIIGSCLLFRFEEASARAELGYVLAQEYWGAGYMFEAMSAFIAFAFGPMGLRRLEAETDPRNLTSAKLLERLGFVREGLLRQRWAVKGELTDSSLYGRLRTDWSALRESSC